MLNWHKSRREQEKKNAPKVWYKRTKDLKDKNAVLFSIPKRYSQLMKIFEKKSCTSQNNISSENLPQKKMEQPLPLELVHLTIPPRKKDTEEHKHKHKKT
ncbi:hypothetical protein H0G86_003258 [Trichoderma simmonsii]|uniref:Uncharacterized protein n=1 Tax=Trichoderma simmonsii TaxID=1491479 RepID=A0A8G0L573_9HYPO|nr:hypothetical protein H0G86_003258 [Trichoderma simmonsii]